MGAGSVSAGSVGAGSVSVGSVSVGYVGGTVGGSVGGSVGGRVGEGFVGAVVGSVGSVVLLWHPHCSKISRMHTMDKTSRSGLLKLIQCPPLQLEFLSIV